MICVLFAHPYADRSRANRRLLAALDGLPSVEVRRLYDLYPDFDIDVAAEQEALLRATALVFQHPIYWYSVPGLLKHWFDKVLVRGFAYGEGRRALLGKRCLWVTTTGGETESYAPGLTHGRPFAEYMPVIEQTALFCGMHWEPPLVLHGAHRVSDAQLAEHTARYRAHVAKLAAGAELAQPGEAP
jgi:glutathione-regulated potassium-efflux system ancillary protein KefF